MRGVAKGRASGWMCRTLIYGIPASRKSGSKRGVVAEGWARSMPRRSRGSTTGRPGGGGRAGRSAAVAAGGGRGGEAAGDEIDDVVPELGERLRRPVLQPLRGAGRERRDGAPGAARGRHRIGVVAGQQDAHVLPSSEGAGRGAQGADGVLAASNTCALPPAPCALRNLTTNPARAPSDSFGREPCSRSL